MGKKTKKTKTKTKATSRVPKGGGSGDGTSKKSGKFSADQLLDKVEDYMDSFDFSMAERFCFRALETEPNNTRGLETMGTIHLELGNLDDARQCFSKAIELEPESGHSKYMYLGQLHTGAEAVKAFLKGIELMTKSLGQKEGGGEDQGACALPQCDVTPRDVSSAYCAVAEIYLTDECFEDCAETKCKEYVDKAVEADDSNSEAYHLLSSYWMSKDNKELAKEMIEKGVMLWLPQMRTASETEAPEDPIQVCEVNYPARVNAAKILVEVKNYELASEVLELLLDEEDEVVEVWYLLGWLNYLQGDDYKANAKFYLYRAKEVNNKVGCEDELVVKHVNELLEELGPEEAEEDEDEGSMDCEDIASDDDDGDGDGDDEAKQTSKKTDSQSDAMEH